MYADAPGKPSRILPAHRVSSAAQEVEVLANRLRNLADRLCGCHPRAVDADPATPPPSSVADDLDRSAGMIRMATERANAELARIEETF